MADETVTRRGRSYGAYSEVCYFVCLGDGCDDVKLTVLVARHTMPTAAGKAPTHLHQSSLSNDSASSLKLLICPGASNTAAELWIVLGHGIIRKFFYVNLAQSMPTARAVQRHAVIAEGVL
jgi:hypothetical protein